MTDDEKEAVNDVRSGIGIIIDTCLHKYRNKDICMGAIVGGISDAFALFLVFTITSPAYKELTDAEVEGKIDRTLKRTKEKFFWHYKKLEKEDQGYEA